MEEKEMEVKGEPLSEERIIEMEEAVRGCIRNTESNGLMCTLALMLLKIESPIRAKSLAKDLRGAYESALRGLQMWEDKSVKENNT